MEKNDNLQNSIKIYMSWPIIFGFFVFIIDIIVYLRDKMLPVQLIFCTVVYFLLAFFLYYRYSHSIKQIVSLLENQDSNFQARALNEHSNPYLIINTKGEIIWQNRAFSELCHHNLNVVLIKNISFLSKSINDDVLIKAQNQKYEIVINYENKILNVLFNPINKEVIGVYIADITEMELLKTKFDEEKQIVGLVYIDNYEEALVNVDDGNAAIVNALVDRKIDKYFSENGGLVKKLEKDKYIVITNRKNCREFIQDRFSILDEVRDINIGNGMNITLSIGLGQDAKNSDEGFEFARIAIDMALGRGGDQAVVKTQKDMQYFGGKTSQQEKFTKVRSRVKAKSFREVLDTKDKVLILGHKNADFDTFGASIGVYLMATFLGKETHIVENSCMEGVSELKQKFIADIKYDSNMFITGDEAISFVDDNILLVLVDHNTPFISDEPRLIDLINTKVVIDHHRKNENSFTNAVLQHIEPKASSASELVCEMLEYFDDKIALTPLEAESLLLGIVVDTNYFVNQTSAKTFDAASYLKKNGADIGRIRNVLKIPSIVEDAKNNALNNKQMYKDSFAITVIEGDSSKIDLQLVAAETANELIRIQGIKASIVLTQLEKYIAVSARSIDQVNVQVLMEKLGGGGHKSQAACQLRDVSMDEAIVKIKEAIDIMEEENEIV